MSSCDPSEEMMSYVSPPSTGDGFDVSMMSNGSDSECY